MTAERADRGDEPRRDRAGAGELGLADAALTLSGASLSYRKIRIEQPALALSLAGGAVEIGRFSGSIFGGSITASGWSDCAAGRGNLSFDLSNWRVHAELALRPLAPAEAPPVTLTVGGPPDKASVSTDVGALEAYLAAHRAAAPAP